MSIRIDISVGELLDKITILEIKSEKIKDCKKLNNVNIELSVLNEAWCKSNYFGSDIDSLRGALKQVNEALWQIEDDIRLKERGLTFDQEFIELARSVYLYNDKRARIKSEINFLTSSKLFEEKSYA